MRRSLVFALAALLATVPAMSALAAYGDHGEADQTADTGLPTATLELKERRRIAELKDAAMLVVTSSDAASPDDDGWPMTETLSDAVPPVGEDDPLTEDGIKPGEETGLAKTTLDGLMKTNLDDGKIELGRDGNDEEQIVHSGEEVDYKLTVTNETGNSFWIRLKLEYPADNQPKNIKSDSDSVLNGLKSSIASSSGESWISKDDGYLYYKEKIEADELSISGTFTVPALQDDSEEGSVTIDATVDYILVDDENQPDFDIEKPWGNDDDDSETNPGGGGETNPGDGNGETDPGDSSGGGDNSGTGGETNPDPGNGGGGNPDGSGGNGGGGSGSVTPGGNGDGDNSQDGSGSGTITPNPGGNNGGSTNPDDTTPDGSGGNGGGSSGSVTPDGNGDGNNSQGGSGSGTVTPDPDGNNGGNPGNGSGNQGNVTSDDDDDDDDGSSGSKSNAELDRHDRPDDSSKPSAGTWVRPGSSDSGAGGPGNSNVNEEGISGGAIYPDDTVADPDGNAYPNGTQALPNGNQAPPSESQEDDLDPQWTFVTEDGTLARGGWYLIYCPGTGRNEWYHFDENGYMDHGWFRESERVWYYLSEADDATYGSMVRGWHYDEQDGRWYFVNRKSGVIESGWQEIDGHEYYFEKYEDVPRQTWFLDADGTWKYDADGIRSYGSMYADEDTPDGAHVDANGVKQ